MAGLDEVNGQESSAGRREGGIIKRASDWAQDNVGAVIIGGTLALGSQIAQGSVSEANAQEYTCRHIQPEQPSSCIWSLTAAGKKECINDSKAESARIYYLRKESCRGYLLAMGQYEEYLRDTHGIIIDSNGGVYSSTAGYTVRHSTGVPFYDNSGLRGVDEDGFNITLSFNSGTVITFHHGGSTSSWNGINIRAGYIQ